MQPVLTAHEMSLADRLAIEELRTGETRLMELAGREIARLLAEEFGDGVSIDGKAFLVVCGKGNNGGDGFVAARHLLNLGALVDVLPVWQESELSGVNLENYNILKAYRQYNEGLRIFPGIGEISDTIADASYDAVLDALFGTGFKVSDERAQLDGLPKKAVELINRLGSNSDALVVSVDLPSGLDATTGRCAEPWVRSDMTVTMGFLKTGFFQNDGPSVCGRVVPVEISIPRFLIEPARCMVVDESFAAESFLLRDPSSAKHLNGKVLLITGSVEKEGASMIGAALLASRAAVKAGAGYVCVSLPPGQAAAMHGFSPEVIVTGRDMDSILERVRWADAIVIGCGLGRSESSQEFIETLLRNPEIASKKLVIDADALFAIASRNLFDLLPTFPDALLTPHSGECARLSDMTVREIMDAPIDTIRNLASAWKVNVLLKGNPTYAGAPDGTVLISDSGTEALATAGTGDVLAGMIGALAAKGLDTFEAAAASAWLHGRAGDLASDVSSLVSSLDVLQAIPQAVLELFEKKEE